MKAEHDIGIKIRTLRKQYNLSQTSLAKQLNTTQDTISLWELNKSYPDVVSIIALCRIFDISSDYLLGLSDF